MPWRGGRPASWPHPKPAGGSSGVVQSDDGDSRRDRGCLAHSDGGLLECGLDERRGRSSRRTPKRTLSSTSRRGCNRLRGAGRTSPLRKHRKCDGEDREGTAKSHRRHIALSTRAWSTTNINSRGGVRRAPLWRRTALAAATFPLGGAEGGSSSGSTARGSYCLARRIRSGSMFCVGAGSVRRWRARSHENKTAQGAVLPFVVLNSHSCCVRSHMLQTS